MRIHRWSSGSTRSGVFIGRAMSIGAEQDMTMTALGDHLAVRLPVPAIALEFVLVLVLVLQPGPCQGYVIANTMLAIFNRPSTSLNVKR